jgi:hypothetical protein
MRNPSCDDDDVVLSELMTDLEVYEHSLDHIALLQQRLREADAREDRRAVSTGS